MGKYIPRENINIVVKLQKRAARLVLDADFSIRSKLLFSELKRVPFPEIVKFHQLSPVFKCINNLVPTYLHNMFRPKSNNHYLFVEILWDWPIRCTKTTHQKFIAYWSSIMEQFK